MEKCIQQIKEGDYSSISALYNECISEFILRVQAKFHCSPELAEDAIHGAFIATIENILSGTLEGFTHGLKAYVRRTADNMILKTNENNRIHRNFCNDYNAGLIPGMNLLYGRQSDTNDEIKKEQRMTLLFRVLDQIKAREFAIIDLFYFKGMGEEDIAEILGYKNANTVGNIKSRIVDKLRKMMKDCGAME